MGQLKPGVTYIHERVDNVVYAREFGADPSTRKVVGWDYNKDNPAYDPRNSSNKELAAHNEWIKIRLAGKKNPALQKAIDNVIIIYRMTAKYE
jgi:hypothetical protein